jgi:radical SAM superfamily enzyme YgiQ (UPF0313 family)
MKIKLIAPSDGAEKSTSSSETFKIQRLSLPILAAITPEKHDVVLVDEAFVPDDLDYNFDIVGISVLTDLVKRAYSLADHYRKHGVHVVLGGMHSTVLPEEALGHADSVVVGEAEDIWRKLLADIESGNPGKIYRAARPVDMQNIPIPRRDLYSSPNSKGYTPVAYTLEASRGCPYDCEFCSINQVMGKSYRTRPVANIINDIESLNSKNIFFVDDSFGLKRNFSKQLLKSMIPLGKVWVGQGTVSLASDLELLQLLQRSGCKGLLIGFESVEEDAQKTLKKVKTSINFSEAVKRFHDYGIGVLGAFIFGFDNDTKDVFEHTEKFIKDNKLEGAQPR